MYKDLTMLIEEFTKKSYFSYSKLEYMYLNLNNYCNCYYIVYTKYIVMCIVFF